MVHLFEGGRGLKRYSTEFLLNSTYCWHWQGLPLLLCLNIEHPLTVGNICHLYIIRLEQKHKYSATRGMRFICTFSLSFPLVNKFQTSTSTGAGCWEQLGVGGDGGEEEGGRTAARGRGWQVGTSFSRSSLEKMLLQAFLEGGHLALSLWGQSSSLGWRELCWSPKKFSLVLPLIIGAKTWQTSQKSQMIESPACRLTNCDLNLMLVIVQYFCTCPVHRCNSQMHIINYLFVPQMLYIWWYNNNKWGLTEIHNCDYMLLFNF